MKQCLLTFKILFHFRWKYNIVGVKKYALLRWGLHHHDFKTSGKKCKNQQNKIEPKKANDFILIAGIIA